tara:strand:- start:2078 stop:2701 length:624 start_codon:yes stop_codon:yes gene_type:complete
LRFILFVFSTIGFVSIIFLFFSIVTFSNIINPSKDIIKNNYNIVVILSGNPDRALTAANMYFSKNAEMILLSKENSVVKNHFTGNLTPTYEVYLDLLSSKNIERKNILLFGNNRSTYDELRELANINFIKNKNILIITDQYHHYRVRMLLDYFEISEGVDLYPTTSSLNQSNKKYFQNIFLEYMKIILFYSFNDYDNFISLYHKDEK